MQGDEVFGLLLKDDGTVKFCRIKDTLEEWYKALGCDCIDITSRMVEDQIYSIVCDDEALLKETIPYPTILDREMQPLIFGSAFVCLREGPELASLDEKAGKILEKHLYGGVFSTPNSECPDPEIHWCLGDVQYPKC